MKRFNFKTKFAGGVLQFLLPAVITFILSACSYYNPPYKDIPGSKTLIIGDSYFAINRGLSKSMKESGFSVNDHSMEGAQLIGKNFLFAPDVFEQYKNSDIKNIKIIVMDGGGNDIAFQCSEQLIDKNEWKPVVDKVFKDLVLLWETIRKTNIKKIIYIGYPYPPILTEKQKMVFAYFLDKLKNELCPPHNIIFIDLRDKISQEQKEFFLNDRIHPSYNTHILMAKLLKKYLDL